MYFIDWVFFLKQEKILGLQILKSNKKRDRNNILASINQDGRMVADSRSYWGSSIWT